ncbi:hypothetical protein [Peptostreptococcus porci]|uniref:hypothetical protein n=1 Tax=Peptostreptococcus porci TaxID=2652282 RepID=UPI002A82C53D|nr:hypothetical protein [Peptostreptococcus porci]MDY4128595.1 hypothetical protein [Peptostreptococcus porci]
MKKLHKKLTLSKNCGWLTDIKYVYKIVCRFKFRLENRRISIKKKGLTDDKK